MAKGRRDGMVDVEFEGDESSWSNRLMQAAMSGMIAAGGKSVMAGSPAAAGLRRGDGGRLKRRPDRRPFIADIPGSTFFPSRSMPKACSKYRTVIGETFWRLVAYLDSIPSSGDERPSSGHRVPHLMVSGVAGCGKSRLLAAASHLLSDPVNPRAHYSMNGERFCTVLLGDCKRWLESEDPLQYFRMEILTSLCRMEDEGMGTTDHGRSSHPGCLVCVEPFRGLEDVRQFVGRICRWLATGSSYDVWLVLFVDQAEELVGREDSLPFAILQILQDARLPILVYACSTTVLKINEPSSKFPLQVGAHLQVPFRLCNREFNYLMDALSVRDEMWPDVRLWTGGHPGNTVSLLAQTGESTLERVRGYASRVEEEMVRLVEGHVNKGMTGVERNVLLVAIFAMILRVPLDWSDKYSVEELRALPAPLSSLLPTTCLQSFFHPSDGTLSLRSIPTAPSLATHLALASPRLLARLEPAWLALFETVVAAMQGSKQLCAEAKRRFARFYLHAKIHWAVLPADGWCIRGETQTAEEIILRFKAPKVVVFAGQIPAAQHLSFLQPLSTYDSVVFIPGRTAYPFFDALILLPHDRRLHALTTSPSVPAWLKELETRTSPAQLQQHRDEGLVTPHNLLEAWRDSLRRALGGSVKVSVKCFYVRPADLLRAFGSIEPTNTPSDVTASL